MARIGVFGWGIVAPRSPDIDAFDRNLESSASWLEAFHGFGPDSFLVGRPQFDFDHYRDWIVERFSPNRFHQLNEKMDPSCKYAVGAFVQSLQQNPGIDSELQKLGAAARVYMGTGLGSLPTLQAATLELYHAQRRWDRYWSHPERNAPLAAWLQSPAAERAGDAGVPPDPASVADDERMQAEDEWWHYWAARSPRLQEFLAELRDVEDAPLSGDIEAAKLRVIRDKRRRHARLLEKWNCPPPPWSVVSPNVIWNIPNTPASQISMLGRIVGLTFAPVAACSTFGVSLKLAIDAIQQGDVKAVVVGATDPPPHPLVVGAFFNARVLAADGSVSKPLTRLQGTHVSGGSVVWLVCDYDHMVARGFRPLGMEPLAVGVSADADHIITPSRQGPMTAMKTALHNAGTTSDQISSWDLHATATPGDYMEVEILAELLPKSVLVTARKGTFGHGMSAGGGWELTAQYLGYQKGTLYPTPLAEAELHEAIAALRSGFVFDRQCQPGPGVAGKLSMGVGGINACVISRPLSA